MYRLHSIFTAVLTVVAVMGQFVSAQYPAQLKIMTYNINAESHKDGDYTDIGDVIKEIAPTIAGLQKVDSCTVTSKPVDVLKSLGEQTNKASTFSVSYTKNKGAYGNGFLSDSVPKNIRHLAIPKDGSFEDRSALEISITMGGEQVRVIVTHLAFDGEKYRKAQLNKILPWIDEGGAATDPVVIMADFNAQPTAGSMKLLTDAGFAFVKGKNGEILDTSSRQGINHILYRPATRWQINDAGNPKYAASNRNPVWADMELLNPLTASALSIARKRTTEPQLLFFGNTFQYRLDTPAKVSLSLFDAAGKRVMTLLRHEHRLTGTHDVRIPINTLPFGVYYGLLFIDGTITNIAYFSP